MGVSRPGIAALGLIIAAMGSAPLSVVAQTLDPRERAALDGILTTSLESARTGVEVPWREPETGRGGVVIVERTFFLAPDRPCRAFRWTAEQAGDPVLRGQGTGCRIARDNWSLHEDPEHAAPATAPPPAPAPDPVARVEPPPPPRSEPSRPVKQARSSVPPAPKKPPPPAYTLPSATPL
jgi:surface antigen